MNSGSPTDPKAAVPYNKKESKELQIDGLDDSENVGSADLQSDWRKQTSVGQSYDTYRQDILKCYKNLSIRVMDVLLEPEPSSISSNSTRQTSDPLAPNPTGQVQSTIVQKDINRQDASNDCHWVDTNGKSFKYHGPYQKKADLSDVCQLSKAVRRYRRFLSNLSNGRIHRLIWQSTNIRDTWWKFRLRAKWKSTSAIAKKTLSHIMMEYIVLFVHWLVWRTYPRSSAHRIWFYRHSSSKLLSNFPAISL